ncbi:hypothetical protein Acr_17g0004150 [Actinidia rufa]|uniref:Integrase catalytic domain-containing protein n=1 Tax=Actinidia rufa TaxID=165716 RepID=A0A7J0G245_9ERIC|nr:hypothetical protein Acr_17g0004150 [Actinidia rufa]
MGKFEVRGVKMAKYLAVAKNLLTKFKAVKIEQVEWDLNSHADTLAGLALVFEGMIGWTITVELIPVPNLEIPQESVLVNIELGPSWMDLIVNFLQHDKLSEDKKEAHKVRVKDLLEQLKIEFYNLTPSYPQCNGHAEASNKTIMNGIKKRFEKAKGKWAKELPNMLWAYRITLQKATNEIPYSLAFGFEAVIPLEVSLPTIRIEAYDANHNKEVLARDLDLVEERRENALIRMADYQKQLAKTYNQRVQHREFSVGDLILRKVVENTKDPTNGKIGPN